MELTPSTSNLYRFKLMVNRGLDVLCGTTPTTEKPHRMTPMGLCLSLFVLFTSVGTHATWTKPDQTTEP